MGSEKKEKSLPLAIGLNLILPGVGYMYMGKVIVGIGALILILLILASTSLMVLLPVWLGLNLIMAIDMYLISVLSAPRLFRRGLACFLIYDSLLCQESTVPDIPNALSSTGCCSIISRDSWRSMRAVSRRSTASWEVPSSR